LPLLFSCPSMKHGVDDSLIYLTADILIQDYPNTVNARWHEVKSVDVIEKNTERLIRLRNLRNLNTETSPNNSHFVIRCSPHLAIWHHKFHKRCHLMRHVSVLF